MKIKNILLLSSILVGLTACTTKPPPFEDRVAAPPDTLFGVIEPLDQIDIYRAGTHRLRPETGDPILIQSSTLNLNKYLAKKVTLKGESNFSPGIEPPVFDVFEVVSPGEEETSASKTDENQKAAADAIQKGPACGGPKKLQCREGFLCELEGSEEDALGVCVSLQNEDKNPDCPFIPPPDCEFFEPGPLGKNGCPTRYVCDGKEPEEAGDSNPLGRVMDTIMRYQKELLGSVDAKLVQFEVSPEASLIAVVYEQENKKVKKLFEYAPSGPEFNFTEKASFAAEKDDRWTLISGEDVQADAEKKIIYVGQ